LFFGFKKAYLISFFCCPHILSQESYLRKNLHQPHGFNNGSKSKPILETASNWLQKLILMGWIKDAKEKYKNVAFVANLNDRVPFLTIINGGGSSLISEKSLKNVVFHRCLH